MCSSDLLPAASKAPRPRATAGTADAAAAVGEVDTEAGELPRSVHESRKPRSPEERVPIPGPRRALPGVGKLGASTEVFSGLGAFLVAFWRLGAFINAAKYSIHPSRPSHVGSSSRPRTGPGRTKRAGVRVSLTIAPVRLAALAPLRLGGRSASAAPLFPAPRSLSSWNFSIHVTLVRCCLTCYRCPCFA